MSISLTLGSVQLLSNYTSPFILLSPEQADSLALRVELTGVNYQELLNNNFDWHFTHYKFIYLNFNHDQASLFESKFINKSYFEEIEDVLIVQEFIHETKFIIIHGFNKKDSSTRLESDLRTLSTKEFGMFSKIYKIS